MSTELNDIAALLETEAEGEEQEAEAEGEEAEGEEQEAEAEGEEGEEGEEAEGEEGEEPTWASTLGLSDDKIVLDDKGNLAGINVKVEGVVSTVPVSELVAGYQTNKYNTQKSQAISEERKAFEVQATQVAVNYKEKLETAERVIQVVNQQLMQDFEGVDWQQLRATDPGQYAAAYKDFEVRQAQIQELYQAIGQERGTLTQAQQQEFETQQANYLRIQADKIIENNPEWADKNKLQSAFSDLKSFALETYGFNEQDFSGISDARAIEVLKDAMKYRKGKESLSKKDLKTLPKFQTQTRGAATTASSKLQSLVAQSKRATGFKQKALQTSAVAELLEGLV